MTTQEFNKIKNDAENYKGVQVEFTSYIPSADRYTTNVGYIYGVGSGVQEECILISERGLTHSIHYTNVNFK